MDNIKTCTGLRPVEESIRMKEDRDKWRKYIDGVANRRIEDGKDLRTGQNIRHKIPGALYTMAQKLAQFCAP